VFERVIITSSLHPRDVYKNRVVEDKLQQLERRMKFITVIKPIC
jgi:hypothetical protein